MPRLKFSTLALRGGVLALGLLAALSLTQRPSRAQEPAVVLKLIDPTKSDLNEKQLRVLERIKKSPATGDAAKTVKLALLDAAPLLAKGDAPLGLCLTDDMRLDVKGYRLKALPEGGRKEKDGGGILVQWQQKAEPGADAVHLAVAGKSSNGLIFAGDKVFAVEPLGGGVHAVTQIDQSKFKDCDHGKKQEVKEGKYVAVTPATKNDLQNPSVVTVLVAYTPKVDDLQGDVVALINAAVDLANVSYANSQIAVKLELVGTHKVNYVESGTHEKDLAAFMGKGDGQMDEIHDLRDQLKADVCVLLIDNDQYCGLAAQILADDKTAFAVVHHDCAVKNISFAHEVGHLFGARHDIANDPTPGYNHGYLSAKDANKWRTIMAYPAPGKPNRIPWWSNPNLTFQGEPMGTKAQEDNARKLNETAPILSQFR